MSDQEFHGQVGQVAGRDIINEAAATLWDNDTPTLRQEYRRCKAKLWQARRDILFSAPSLWLLLGMLGSIWMALSGLWFEINPYLMMAWPLAAVAVPAWWLTLIRQRKGKMVAHYLYRLELIDTVLQDRA